LIRAKLSGQGERGSAIMRALATASLPRLVHLDLRGTELTAAELAALVANPSLGALATVALDGGVPELRVLAEAPLLGRLERVELTGVAAGEGEAILRDSSYASPWTALELS
jgi:hypothetical protein